MNAQNDRSEDNALPNTLPTLNAAVIHAMAWINGLAHVALGLALATSAIFFIWMFIDEIIQSVRSENLVQGFLHGLGSLMLLWTVSALMAAEIRYLRGYRLTVDTFVEVAIVVILRKLISMPVQSITPNPTEFFIWVSSAVLLGVMYLIVRVALKV